MLKPREMYYPQNIRCCRYAEISWQYVLSSSGYQFLEGWGHGGEMIEPISLNSNRSFFSTNMFFDGEDFGGTFLLV